MLKQLSRVGTLIDTLTQTCEDIRKHVQAAKQETAPMLEEASTLLAQKHETEQKQRLLDSFNKHFLLSDDDLTTLTSSAEPVDDRFFEVLAWVKQIHKDCELLLGYENQRLGLELMEETTRNLNAGYKKLFNWTLREFKGLDLEDPHISGSIRRSLRALSERPALFQNCLDSFAEARQSTVSDAFQKALTDSTMGAARAIEFSTHDPLRYIGDMLAWVHSGTVSEMEALEGLFISDEAEISRGLHQGKAADPFAMPTEEGEDIAFDGHTALNSLISRNMASVAHTLTQRIGITVRNLSDPIEIYKAYNVLSFYHDMFLKLIQHSTKLASQAQAGNEARDGMDDNTLLTALADLQSQTIAHFQSQVLETFHNTIDDTPNEDLTPPQALAECLQAFTTVAQTRGPALTLTEFAKLYSTLLAPVLSSCADLADQAATELPVATNATSTIYKINYTSLVRDALSSIANPTSANKVRIEAAESPLEHAETEITTLRTSLVDLLLDSFADSSGLDDLQQLIEDGPNLTQAPASKKKHRFLRPANLDTEAEAQELVLEVLAARLDAFLASALMDAQESLSKLSDKSLSSSVLRTAVEAFCDRYEELVGVLEEVDEGVEREALARSIGKGHAGKVNGDVGGSDDEEEQEGKEVPSLRDVYPRTIEEVRALLS